MFMNNEHWHHAPLHRFVPGAIHMITAATYQKSHFFKGEDRLNLMQKILLERMSEAGWIPHAWACFPNHYHVIMMAPENGDLKIWVKGLHSKLAIALNKFDGIRGRKVMYQYWDKCLSFDNSYYARLNYVMNNPVKHGLVNDAEMYRFCSARWFRKNNLKVFRNRVASYPYDTVTEPDDFG